MRLRILIGLIMLVCAIAPRVSYGQVTAVDDDYLVNDNEALSLSFADNDSWPAGQTAVYSIVEGPATGSLNLLPNGSFTYTPPLNQFWYRDSVYYSVCANGICATAGVEFYVIFRNTSPFATADYFNVEMNSSRTASVIANDGDPDSLTDPIDRRLHWIKLNNPTNGIVTNFDSSGVFTYVPNNGFIGNDSFQYYVVDHCGLYEVAAVYLTIVAPNQSPVANDQNISTLNEDAVYSGSLTSLVSDPENDPVYFRLIGTLNGGSMQLASNGNYTYTPQPNFTGNTSFTYEVCDPVGQCDQGFVTLFINNVDNDPPLLGNDFKIINEDTPTNVAVAANDSDDTASLTYSLFTQAANGTAAVVSETGIFSYSPNANYFGSDSFVIQACDGVNCSTSTVTMQINGVNDAPVALPFVVNLNEDNASQGLLNTFTDADLETLTFTTPQGNTIAGLTISSNGTYSYSPPANFFGTQTITVQACDNQNMCASAAMTIAVNAVNDLPTVSNDNFTIQEDQNLQGTLATGESDVESAALSYTAQGNAVGGSLVVNTNGTFNYTPNANWFGNENIAIAVCDGDGGCRTSQLLITVTAMNDAPITSNISLATNEDTPLTGSLSGFASDIETPALNYSVAANSSGGAFNASPNGSYTFTPSANYSGIATFTYTACDNNASCSSSTITITINAVNDAPVFNDATITLNEDELQSGLLAITDVDNPSVNITVTGQAQHGAFSINSSGSYTYQPNANFFGSEIITLTACDAANLCDAAQITFAVTAVADAPVVVDDSFVVVEGNAINSTLANNDSDGDNDVLQYTIVSAPLHGQLNLLPNGTFTYTPDAGYFGEEQLIYQACDASGLCDAGNVFINVLSGNTAPAAQSSTLNINEDQNTTQFLSAYITDAEGGVFTFTTVDAPAHGNLQWNSNGSFTYTPLANFNGTDAFTYRVCDSGNLCAEAQVSLNIAAINDAPVAQTDALMLDEDTNLTADLSLNDLEIENEALTYTLTSNAQHGSLALSNAGLLNYTPAQNYFGTETVTYNVCDASGNCTPAILQIAVNAVNDAPVAGNISISTTEDSSIESSLINDIANPENDPLVFTFIGSAVGGVASINTDGTFNFTPTSNFNGDTSFDYEVCDTFGACDQGTIAIHIEAINDAPIAADDNLGTQEDMMFAFNLSNNDSDIENSVLSYSLLSQPLFGSATISTTGQLTYVPNANAFGDEHFDVQVCDDQGACATSIVNIAIQAVNDLPTTTPYLLAIAEDESTTGSVLSAATDIETQQLIFTLADTSWLGSLTFSPTGEFTWEPNLNASGLDTVEYTACDEAGACVSGQFILSVSPVNDAPAAASGTISLSEDSATQGNFFDYATDADGDILTLSILQDVQHGSLVFDSTGHFVFAPTANYFGYDSLVYTACDAHGVCAGGVIHFNVTFLNDLPIVVGEGLQIIVNTALSGSVASNDIELDFEQLVYSVVDDQSGGSFTLHTDGTFEYIPTADTTGLFTITYRACDPCNACAEGTLTLYVVSAAEANTAPTAENFEGAICQGGSTTINLMNLISDAQDDASVLHLSFGTANVGTYQLDPETQELIYQAPSFNSGQVTIPYYVCDNGTISMCDTAYILLTIIPSNDIQITGFDMQQITCYGLNNGSISIQAQGQGALNYTWSNGGNTPAISGLNAGTYSVTITSDQLCGTSQTAEFTITSPAWIQSSFAISDSDGNGTDNGDEVSLNISGGTMPYSITWQTPDGNTIGNPITIGSNGAYSYVIEDANGCSANGNLTVSNTSDMVVDTEVRVFPNPISNGGKIQIVSNERITELSVYDMHGKLISIAQCNSLTWSIDTDSWSSGAYTFHLRTDSSTHAGRIIKQ